MINLSALSWSVAYVTQTAFRETILERERPNNSIRLHSIHASLHALLLSHSLTQLYGNCCEGKFIYSLCSNIIFVVEFICYILFFLEKKSVWKCLTNVVLEREREGKNETRCKRKCRDVSFLQSRIFYYVYVAHFRSGVGAAAAAWSHHSY